MLTEEYASHLLCTCRQTPLGRGCRSQSTCLIASPPRRLRLALQRTTVGNVPRRAGLGHQVVVQQRVSTHVHGAYLASCCAAVPPAKLNCFPAPLITPAAHPAQRSPRFLCGWQTCKQLQSIQQPQPGKGPDGHQDSSEAAVCGTVCPSRHTPARPRRALPSCRHGGSGLEKAGARHTPISLLSFIQLLEAVRRRSKSASGPGRQPRPRCERPAQAARPIAIRCDRRPADARDHGLATPPGFAVPAWRRKTACPLL